MGQETWHKNYAGVIEMNRTELANEMIGLMCVQTKYFSGRTYRSRIEIIMLAYDSIFRRRKEEEKSHDR